LPPFIAGDFLWEGRAGAYKAHIPSQHVIELGKFVDAESAEISAKPSNSGVFGGFENRAIHFIKDFEFETGLFGVINHGSKLVHRERSAVEATPFLLKKYGAWRCQSY